jgi:hypothetical protein
MIKLLPKSPDFITLQNFEDIEFNNCESDAMTYFFEPPESWANLADCGDFPCTGPKNTMMNFKNIKWTGSSVGQPNTLENFTLIPWTKDYTDQFPDCGPKIEKMNGHMCTTNDLGILVWESQDPDSIDRSIQPIHYRIKESLVNYNKLNSYMDHNCDSFYNSQQRISRFPGLVYAGKKDIVIPEENLPSIEGLVDDQNRPIVREEYTGLHYEVFMTGTPPKKMRWRLDTSIPENGFTVMIKFPSALARAVLIGGEEVPYNQWQQSKLNKGQGEYGPILQEKCGENRYRAVKNILEFFISGECELEINPRDAIMTKVRMEWTMGEFFAKGGTTAFIDRLCASLGIHASTVKVVGVNSGSVVVDYEITPAEDEPMSIEQIAARQTEQFATGTMNLGAPILDVSENGSDTVSDGVVTAAGFTATVLV